MKISAVIPAYNSEKYIARAITSITNQSFQPIEIIVVDDGSTDNTCEAALAASDLVTSLSQPNSGASAARNTGIKAAKGDFIAFLDSDDEWLPGHLERAVSVLISYPFLGWYCAPTIIKDEKSGKTISMDYFTGKLKDQAYVENFFTTEASYHIMSTITTVLRKDLFSQVGGFNERMHRGEDKEMWFRLGFSYPQLGFSSNPGAIYWQRIDSISHVNQESKVEETLDYIRHIQSLAEKKGSEAVKKSAPLVLSTIKSLIFTSIKYNNTKMLQNIYSTYGDKLNLIFKLIILVGKMIPKPVMPLISKLKSIIKPW